MSENVRESIQRHQAFYEVMPYYVVVDERPLAKRQPPRTVKAGFDIDVYGTKFSDGPQHSAEYIQAYDTLKNVVATVRPDAIDCCRIEAIPFYSTVYFDPRKDFERQVLLRIRITHGRGMDQPLGEPEERALRQVQEQLDGLGLSRR